MISEQELAYWLALWRTSRVGPATFNSLLTLDLSLATLFKNPQTLGKHLNLPENILHALKQPDWQGVEKDLAWATQPNNYILTQTMSAYPRQLREIAQAPPILFIRGDPSLLTQQQLAMVGSRHPTATGRDNAYQFAKSFASAELVITSGLALGIDAACHEGAMAGEGKTIAVMGTGPDQLYPKRHQALAKRIAEQGALVTEFPTGTLPMAANFPRRNRIISGLSLGVVVVEAAYGSGSLITAQMALEQNREVFAMPGSIHNPLARGCHALIKQGAKLIETAQDVLDELPVASTYAKQQTKQPAKQSTKQKISTCLKNKPSPPILNLPSDQIELLNCIGDEITAVDQIIERSGLTAEKVSASLLMLELAGAINPAPGGYIRVR